MPEDPNSGSNRDGGRPRRPNVRVPRVRTVYRGPSSVVMWFIVDLLAVALVGAAVLTGLFFLRFSFGVFFANAVRPLELFAGSAVPLIIAATVLATSVVLVLLHNRYLYEEDERDYRYFGIAGLILVLADGGVISFMMYQFFAHLATFRASLPIFLTVQAVAVVGTLYFSSSLKGGLMTGLYHQTVHSGLAKIGHYRATRNFPSETELSWLKTNYRYRKEELQEWDQQYRELVEELRNTIE